MDNYKISDIVLFGVESVLSFVADEKRVTPEQMLEHLAKSLGEKFGLSKNVDKICKPFYWGLVYPGDKPAEGQPFFLRNETINGDPKNYITRLALKEGVNLSDSFEIACITHRVIKEYGETLTARM